MRKDNRGMTLIELLVAITILAVVVSPFLNTFFIAAKQNNKSREILRATTVAQNLMEGLRAFSLEDICRQINSPAADSKLYLPKGYEDHKELLVLSEENQLEMSGNGLTGEEYIFLPTSQNRYEFVLGGIQEDGKKYDAKIFLDASGNENLKKKNDFQVSRMKESTDAIFSLGKEEEEQFFADAQLSSQEGADAIRTFLIEIKEESDTTKVEIRVLYKHALKGEKTGKSLTKSFQKLNNVYLMYYPNYASMKGGIKDNFEIIYDSSEKVNLYLVKQKYQEPKPDNFYVSSLKVEDKNSDQEPRILLRTNIMQDLYHEENTQSYATAMTYEYTCSGKNIGNDFTAIEKMFGFVDGKPQSLIGQTDDQNAIYKTKVQIYPAGTYPDRYEEEEPLAVLEN